MPCRGFLLPKSFCPGRAVLDANHLDAQRHEPG